jgi:hypothetical protein
MKGYRIKTCVSFVILYEITPHLAYEIHLLCDWTHPTPILASYLYDEVIVVSDYI